MKKNCPLNTTVTKIIKVNHSIHLHCSFFNNMELNLILNSQLSTDWYSFQTFHTLQGGLFQLLETVVIFDFFSWQPCIYLSLYP